MASMMKNEDGGSEEPAKIKGFESPIRIKAAPRHCEEHDVPRPCSRCATERGWGGYRGVPKKPDLKNGKRVNLYLDDPTLSAIDLHQEKHDLGSRSEAVRHRFSSHEKRKRS
jgi:hypothetical protein